jgi:uncharacterized protein
VVLGISAGGAVAVSAAAHDDRIAGLVTIGAFADLSQTIARQTPWLSSGMRSRGMRRAETMAQFDIAQTSPQTLIAQVKGPKLIMHGQLDDYIPFHDGEVLFAAATGEKAFYPIPGANHATMLSVDGDAVREKIVDFVDGIRASASLSQLEETPPIAPGFDSAQPSMVYDRPEVIVWPKRIK